MPIIQHQNSIHNAFEQKWFAAVTLCALSRAFDKFSHQILPSKLRHYNIKGKVLMMFQRILTGFG